MMVKMASSWRKEDAPSRLWDVVVDGWMEDFLLSYVECVS